MSEARKIVADLRPVLIVIDTLARSMPGGDENGSGMGLALEAADRLRESSGACVMLIHHGTKAGTTPRGNSALEGAADTVVKVVRQAGTGLSTFTVEKQKDSEDGLSMRLRLLEVEGTKSCVLVSASGSVLGPVAIGLAGDALSALSGEFATEGATLAELCALLGSKRPTLVDALSPLLASGRGWSRAASEVGPTCTGLIPNCRENCQNPNISNCRGKCQEISRIKRRAVFPSRNGIGKCQTKCQHLSAGISE